MTGKTKFREVPADAEVNQRTVTLELQDKSTPPPERRSENHGRKRQAMTVQPLQIISEEDSPGSKDTVHLKAMADNRVLATAKVNCTREGSLDLDMEGGSIVPRAVTEHTKQGKLYVATIRNHPSNWQGDLSQTFDTRESAMSFANRGLMDIVGRIDTPS